MAAISSSALAIPGTSLGVVTERASLSTLARLSPERPTLFGPVTGATFTGTPKAQVVGESEKKDASEVKFETFKADPIKIQTSVRVTDEFIWGDEDYRLGVLDGVVAPAIGDSISRAVDLLAYHGVNPATGAKTPKMPKFLAQTANTVNAAGKNTDELIAAIGATKATANGVALDSMFGFGLATEQNQLGAPRNPGLGFGQDVSSVLGLNAAIGSTVAGTPEIKDTGIKAIVGDFSQVRWGFQRQIPLELIRFGDPDNTNRDLAGHNEVLLRAEAVLYIAIGDLSKFAVVKAAGGAEASE